MSLRNTIRRTADLRREVIEREAILYGPLLEDVMFLRRRGFILHAEGKRVRLGNRLVSRSTLHDIAARERRLIRNARGDR
ncbi:MAG: hypothetical protein JSR24_19825 [Proteobacteria bacterium]|nr:hypothetical protein [Pseudomonadota bacterium]